MPHHPYHIPDGLLLLLVQFLKITVECHIHLIQNITGVFAATQQISYGHAEISGDFLGSFRIDGFFATRLSPVSSHRRPGRMPRWVQRFWIISYKLPINIPPYLCKYTNSNKMEDFVLTCT